MKNRILTFFMAFILFCTSLGTPTFALENEENKQVFEIEDEWTEEEIRKIYDLLNQEDQDFENLFDFSKIKNIDPYEDKVEDLFKSAKYAGGLELSELKPIGMQRSSNDIGIDKRLIDLTHKVKVNLMPLTYHTGKNFDLTIFPDQDAKVTVSQYKKGKLEKTSTKVVSGFGEVIMDDDFKVYYLNNDKLEKFDYTITFVNEKEKINLISYGKNIGFDKNKGINEQVFEINCGIYQIANSTVKLELPTGTILNDNISAKIKTRDIDDENKIKETEFIIPKDKSSTILRKDWGIKNATKKTQGLKYQAKLDTTFDLSYLDDNYPISLAGEVTKTDSNGQSLREITLDTDKGNKTFTVTQIGNYKVGWTIKLEPIKYSYMSLNANGGKFSDSNEIKNIELETTGAIKDKSQVEEPTRDGYTFRGWYTSKVTNELTQYQTTQEVKDEFYTDKDTIYAHWYQNKYGPYDPDTPSDEPDIPEHDKDKYVTVTFEALDNGNLIMPDSNPEKKVKKVAYKIYKELDWSKSGLSYPSPKPNDGYEFDKWEPNAIPTNGKVSDKNFQASFKKKTTKPPVEDNVRVRFDTDGGEPKPNDQVIEKGKTATKPSQNPYKEGYKFKFWSRDGKIEFDFSTKLYENTTLIAIYERYEEPTRPDRGPSPGYYIFEYPDRALPKYKHMAYIFGYPDKSVKPNGNITRAEAAAVIARLEGLDMSNTAKPNYKDVRDGWYNGAINAVMKRNLMDADDNKFRPDEPITRAEFARAIAPLDLLNNNIESFDDVRGHRYEREINILFGNSRIKGYEDQTFKPDGKITRAEASVILNSLYKRKADSKSIEKFEKEIIKFTDLDKNHWAYYDLVEATNSHEYVRRHKDSIVEDWIKLIK